MALPFVNFGEDQTRSKLLAIVRLQEEIEGKHDHLCETTSRIMQVGLEMETLESQVKHWEMLGNECKEYIKNAKEELEAVKEELGQKDLETFLSQCGRGILCESRDDVRAFSFQERWTGIIKDVCVDLACPNYNEVLEEAAEHKLNVYRFKSS